MRSYTAAPAPGWRLLEFGRERAEVLVDCATYLVLETVGLDVSGESVPYVADWGEDGALEAAQAFAGRIDAVARRIEDALADEPPPTSATETATTT